MLSLPEVRLCVLTGQPKIKQYHPCSVFHAGTRAMSSLRVRQLGRRPLEMCHTFDPGCSLHTPETLSAPASQLSARSVPPLPQVMVPDSKPTSSKYITALAMAHTPMESSVKNVNVINMTNVTKVTCRHVVRWTMRR